MVWYSIVYSIRRGLWIPRAPAARGAARRDGGAAGSAGVRRLARCGLQPGPLRRSLLAGEAEAEQVLPLGRLHPGVPPRVLGLRRPLRPTQAPLRRGRGGGGGRRGLGLPQWISVQLHMYMFILFVSSEALK